MKERVYEITCWQGFLNYVKENLKRPLTEKDYRVLMVTYYINGISAEQTVKEMEG